MIKRTNQYQSDLNDRVENERERTILSHIKLVKAIARGIHRNVPSSIELADLESAGSIGLIRAVDSFEEQRGTPFDAFARKYIRGSILDVLRKADPVGYSTRRKIRMIDTNVAQLLQKLGRTPSTDEIARSTHMEPEEVLRLIDYADAITVEELADPDRHEGRAPDGEPVRTAEERLEQRQLLRLVTQFLLEMPENERLVITLYYFEGLRMREIGRVLELTESRISQIHQLALAALRAQIMDALRW